LSLSLSLSLSGSERERIGCIVSTLTCLCGSRFREVGAFRYRETGIFCLTRRFWALHKNLRSRRTNRAAAFYKSQEPRSMDPGETLALLRADIQYHDLQSLHIMWSSDIISTPHAILTTVNGSIHESRPRSGRRSLWNLPLFS
jgi:hypothetical protein